MVGDVTRSRTACSEVSTAIDRALAAESVRLFCAMKTCTFSDSIVCLGAGSGELGAGALRFAPRRPRSAKRGAGRHPWPVGQHEQLLSGPACVAATELHSSCSETSGLECTVNDWVRAFRLNLSCAHAPLCRQKAWHAEIMAFDCRVATVTVVARCRASHAAIWLALGCSSPSTAEPAL